MGASPVYPHEPRSVGLGSDFSGVRGHQHLGIRPLEDTNKATLQVRMKKDIRFIQANHSPSRITMQVKQDLKPNLEAVPRPIHFLFGSSPRLDVKEVKPFLPLGPAHNKV
jgi:hypothetical protein